MFLRPAILVGLFASAAATADAQAPAIPDSMVHRLAPVTTVADAVPASGLARRRALVRENRQLERQLRAYDRRIDQLEDSLTYLQTVVTDSLKRDIVALDSATFATRERRRQLEERLRLAEQRRDSDTATRDRNAP